MSDRHHVVIVHPHAEYEKGDIVTDADLVAALLRDHPAKVLKVLQPAPLINKAERAASIKASK